MGKKKTPAQKKAAASRAVSPLPPTNNDESSSPAASSFVKDGNEGSEPNEAMPDTTTTDTTPAPSMSKSQKKKARKASVGAVLGDESAALPTDTPTEPTDKSEDGAPSILATNESDKVKESNSAPNASLDAAAPPAAEAVDDAWGFDETAEQTKPTTADIDDSSAKPQNGSSADAQPVQPTAQDVAPVENKILKEDTPTVPAHDAADMTTSSPPATNDEPNAQVSNPVVTKSPEETVIPSGVVADSQGQISSVPESGKTGPNHGGISMSSFDDDNKPLAALTNRGKPTIDTHVKSPGEKQAPGENLGGSSSRSFNASQGLFSGGSGSVQSANVSSSPTAPPSGGSGRNPGGVGPGSGAPAQAPAPSTPSFNFGFGGSKQTPKSASGTSWGMGSSKANPPAPAPPAKSKWGWSGFSEFANKAQKALESAIDGDNAAQPPRTPAKATPPPKPQAPAPAPAPTPAPVPLSPVSNTPAPPPPAKSQTLDEKLAALRAKRAGWTAQKEPKPDEPKSSPTSAIPPSNHSPVEPPTSPPIQAPEKAQSDVTTTPASAPNDAQPSMPELAPVDDTKVTSALPSHMTHSPDPQPHANSAESGNDGNLAALFDSHTDVPAAPGSTVSSKTATSGLRLDTQPVPDDSLGRKRDSFEFDSTSTPVMNRRPPLGDPRSSSSSSPKTPYTFTGAGLGNNFPRLNAGRGMFGGGAFGAPGGFGRQPQHQSPMATPVGEGPGLVGKVEKSGNDDDVSSVTGSVQDVDSNVDDSQLDAAAAVALLPDAPINIDAPALPTTFSLPPVEPLPPPLTFSPFQAPHVPPKPADPSPIDSKPLEIPPPDEPIATEAPEPVAKDELPVEPSVEAPAVKDETPVVQPAEAAPAPEEEVKPEEPAVITPIESAAEVAVESVATPIEPAPASPLEQVEPSPVELSVPSPIEQAAPSPVEPIASSPVEPAATTPIEPVAVAPVEPTPAAPVEEVPTAPVDPVVAAPEEPAVTSSVEPTPATPIEPAAPSVEDKETKEVAPAAKPELAIQVPATINDSSNPKSPEPPTPAAGKNKKKKKKARKSGAAAEEPVTPSVVSKPGPVSEPAPDAEATSVFFSEPASEPVLASVAAPEPKASAEPVLVDLAPEPAAVPIEAPVKTPVEAPAPVEIPIVAETPVAVETLAPLETPAPLELKTEPTAAVEVAQSIQAPEPQPAEALKEPSEPAPEPLKDTEPKEEPVSPTTTKASKNKGSKKKRKNSALPSEPTPSVVEEPPAAPIEVSQPAVPQPEVSQPEVKASKKKKRKSSAPPSEPAPSVVEESPAPPVQEASQPEAKAEEVVEPVAPAVPVVAVEESPVFEPIPVAEEPLKNEETLTAVPDEGIVTPRAISQPLPESPVDPIPVSLELPAETPVEASSEPTVELAPEAIEEPTVEHSVEPVIDPELVPIPAESPVEAAAEAPVEPAVEPATELVVEPIVAPVTEPISVEPVVEPLPVEPIVVEPVAEPVDAPVAEQVIDLVSELVPKSIAEPVIKLFARPSVEPVVEPAAEQQVADMVQPVVELTVETTNEQAPEPVLEAVPETPKDALPPIEAKDQGATKSKSTKKKKGSKRKVEVVEETPVVPESTSVVDKSVVDAPTPSPVVETVAQPEPVAIPDPIEPVAVSPTTPKKKKKSKKVNAVSPAPTPVEEKMPALPEPVVAATAIPEIPEFNNLETTPAPVPALIPESGLRVETTPKVVPIEIPCAPSPIDVPSVVPAPVQLDEATAPVPQETVPEPESGREPSPIDPPGESVLATTVQQTPSPVSEPPPLLPSPPRSAAASPRVRAVPELLMSPKPSKSSKKTRRDKTPSLSQMPELSSPSPIRPSFENPAPTQTATPLSPSPVSEPAGQSSLNIASFGHGSDHAAEANHRPASRGSVSSITSIDTDTKPSAEKAKVRPSMPPLISIPITPSTPVAMAYQTPAAKPSEVTAASEKEETIVSPSGLPSAAPVDETPAKSEVAAKPTTPGVLGGFKPFRWFGFGAAPSPIAPSPVVPSPVVASSVIASPVVEKKPERAPSIVASPVTKDLQNQTQTPKETPDPARNVSSPVPLVAPRPRSPVVEKTEWSRWPHQPAANGTALPRPAVNERTPSKRDFHPLPRVDSQSKPIRPSVTPVVAPVIPIIPAVAVAPVPSRTNPSPVSDDQDPVKRASSSSPPRPAVFKVATPVSSVEKESPLRRPPVVVRAVSPASNTPPVMFQSPPSSAGTLPAYSAQAPVVTQAPVVPQASVASQAPAASQAPVASLAPAPAPSPAPTSNSASKPPPARSILKQRPSVPSTPRTPVSPPHSNSQAPKFEFARSQHVPIYDDWSHAPTVRRDLLASAGASRSPQQEQPPSATTASPTLARNRGADETQQRPRKKHSTKELTSSHKANRARTPSPVRGTRTTLKPVVSPPKPNLVPVLNEKIIRPKAPKPAKISTATARSPGGNYVEPLSSPILLTAESYTARLPENTIYQYDVRINSSEPLPPQIRKRIFDILQKEVAPQVFSPLARATFDGKKFMYAHKRLNVSSRQEFSVELTGEQAGIYTVRLKKLAEINPHISGSFR